MSVQPNGMIVVRFVRTGQDIPLEPNCVQDLPTQAQIQERARAIREAKGITDDD